MSLSKQSRHELKEILYDMRRDGMFGDGLEDEYIMNGVNLVGLNQMEDIELIAEYEDSIADDTDVDLIRWKAELIMGKLGLSSEEKEA